MGAFAKRSFGNAGTAVKFTIVEFIDQKTVPISMKKISGWQVLAIVSN